jgi:hypothetical protein
MIKDFDTVKAQLKELSDVINSYKSESVQLRLVDLIFGSFPLPNAAVPPEKAADDSRSTPAKRRKKRITRSPTNGGNGGNAAKADGTTSAAIAPTSVRATRSSSSSRPGAKATLSTLYDEGFFKQARTIGGLVAHCDQNLASKFKQSDFSGALARYVREKKLTRAKNGDSQYEYTQP